MLAASPTARVAELQQGPTSHQTYRLIQVLRAVAAEMVVVFHATTLLHLHDRNFSVWENGVAGVEIFFVISGFVMMISTTPLLGSAHPARIFLVRRLERIVPLYWLLTSAKVIAVLIVPTIAVVGLGGWWHVLASYLFFPTRSPIGEYNSVLAVGWTLIFEMFFYLLFAIVLAARLPRLPALAPALVLLAFAWNIPFVVRHGTLNFYASTLQLEFLFGMLLAVSIPQIQKLPRALAFLLAIAGFLILFLYHSPITVVWAGFLYGIPGLAVVASAVALEPSFGSRTPRWLLEIGDASYSIYLVHGFVLPAVCTLFARSGNHRALIFPLAIIVSLLVATIAGDIVYRLIERPMMHWFRGRRRPAIPANA